MSIDEAIRHCLEVADGQTAQGRCPECAADHRQLAEWLTDYKRLKERESCYAISRQAALDAISRIGLCKCSTNEVQAVAECLRAVEILPPVNPQPKMGRWVIVEDRTDWFDATYECSCCKREIIVPYDARNEVYKDYPYCHCGAKMVDSQKGEEEE